MQHILAQIKPKRLINSKTHHRIQKNLKCLRRKVLTQLENVRPSWAEICSKLQYLKLTHLCQQVLKRTERSKVDSPPIYNLAWAQNSYSNPTLYP